MSHRSRNLPLLILLAAAFAVRLGWVLMQPRDIDPRLPDQYEYLQLARNLLNGEGLRFYDPRFLQWVYAYRTPGYPLLLAACGASPLAARLLQVLLDVSTVFAVYRLAGRWMNPLPALAAAALTAFNPFLVYFSGLVLSETLFTAMLTWGLLLISRPRVFWGGLLLALSVLVRPSAIALPVFLGLLAALANYHPGELPRESRLRLPVGATMILLIFLVLAPWAVRNYVRLGEWVWLTTNGGITRYDGFNPEANGASNQSFLQDLDLVQVRPMSEVQRDEYFAAKATQYVRETWRKDPMRLIQLTGAKIARTWSPVPLSDDFGRPLYRMIGLLFSIPLDLLVVCALGASRLPRWVKVFLLAPAVYFTVVHALSVGSLRYRVPAEPALAVLAGAGLSTLAHVVRRPAWRRAMVEP